MKDTFTSDSNKKIRIFLLSPYRIVQESLKTLIENEQRLRVVGSQSLENLPSLQDLKNADIILVNLIYQGTKAVELIASLLEVAPTLRIIVITAKSDLESQIRAVELGAAAIIHKEENTRVLIEAIKKTYNGGTCITRQLLTGLLKNKKFKRGGSKSWNLLMANGLTMREKEVIQMIGKGLKNKEIAKMLFISDSTVRHHLGSIYEKLEVKDRLNLVIYAYQHALIQIGKPDVTN